MNESTETERDGYGGSDHGKGEEAEKNENREMMREIRTGSHES